MKKLIVSVFAGLILVPLLPAVSFCLEINKISGSKKVPLEELLFMEIPSVITASKYEQSVNDAPAVATVITKEEIKKFGANNLHDILNRAPSVYTIGQYLNVDGNTSIRGDLVFGQDLHVLLLLNGRPLRDIVGGYNMAFYEGFPIEMIERIEIIRGPGSVLYGSNAYVGVINIITREAKNTNVKAVAGGGSFGTYLGSVSCDIVKGGLAIAGGLKYLDSSGWRFTATDENMVTRSQDYSKHNAGLNASISYKKLFLNIYGSTIKDSCMGNIPIWSSNNTIFYMINHVLLIDAGYTQDLSYSWHIQYNLSYTFTEMDLATIFKSKDYLGELMILGELSDQLNVAFGSVMEKKISPENVNIKPLDQNNFSSYLQFGYNPLQFLKTSAGIQYNQPYKGYPGVVPRLSAIINANECLGVKLLYAEAFRSPSLSELYIDATVLKGNPDLQAENIATTDVQVFYNKEHYNASLTYFNSRYYNMIARGPALPLPASYVNAGGVKVDGVDLEGKASLRRNLNMLGSYSYQKNKSDSNIEDYMQISNHMVKLGVIYDMKSNVSIGLFNQYYSKPPDVVNAYPMRKLYNPVPDAFNWVTLNLLYKASDRVDFNLYCTNLLDQSVYYPEFGRKKINSLPGEPGTAVYLKVGITL